MCRTRALGMAVKQLASISTQGAAAVSNDLREPCWATASDDCGLHRLQRGRAQGAHVVTASTPVPGTERQAHLLILERCAP